MKQEIDNNAMWAAFRQELALQGELQVVAAIDNALNNLGFTIEETSTIVPIPLKQGEQKPTDKVEPKFKVGDVIRLKGSAAEYTIKRVTDTTYYTDGWSCSIERCEEDYELVEQKTSVWSEEDVAMLDSAIAFVEHSAFTTIGKGKNNVIAWLKSIKDKAQPQPQPRREWSEDDEMRFNNIFTLLEELPLSQSWFKSLKDRVQPQPKWSEDDDRMYNRIVSFIPQHLTAESYTACINWLKSLRPQSQWKPSDEQMKALGIAIQSGIQLGTWEENVLKSLAEQLKKLREE